MHCLYLCSSCGYARKGQPSADAGSACSTIQEPTGQIHGLGEPCDIVSQPCPIIAARKPRAGAKNCSANTLPPCGICQGCCRQGFFLRDCLLKSRITSSYKEQLKGAKNCSAVQYSRHAVIGYGPNPSPKEPTHEQLADARNCSALQSVCHTGPSTD
jgi:hypothetical protein